MPVSTAYERTKFGEMWMTYARASRSQSFLDFDAFAIEWNKAVSAIEERQESGGAHLQEDDCILEGLLEKVSKNKGSGLFFSFLHAPPVFQGYMQANNSSRFVHPISNVAGTART